MTKVIKATDRNRGIHGVAFNFDDMSTQAGGYLDKVRAEAAKIVAKAGQEAEAIRQQAERDGRQAALAAIDKLLDDKLAKQLETLLPAVRAAAEQIQVARHGWLAHWERRAVHLAAAIAERVLRRELTNQPDVPLDLIREALQLAGGVGRMRLLVNPADKQALGGQMQALVNECAAAAACEVVGDPAIAPGGCRVETEYGAVDQQFAAQLARIEEELT